MPNPKVEWMRAGGGPKFHESFVNVESGCEHLDFFKACLRNVKRVVGSSPGMLQETEELFGG